MWNYGLQNREYRESNAERERNGLRSIRFKQADAFNAANYSDRWDIVVASGFGRSLTTMR
jgi:hypothetical protein